MNISEKEVVLHCGDLLKCVNVFYQYLCSENQILIANAYKKLRNQRSKNELEKSFN